MKTVISADIIDFATAARQLRLRRRRSELQRLRVAQAARMAQACGLPALRAGPAAAAGMATMAPAPLHVVAR